MSTMSIVIRKTISSDKILVRIQKPELTNHNQNKTVSRALPALHIHLPQLHIPTAYTFINSKLAKDDTQSNVLLQSN